MQSVKTGDHLLRGAFLLLLTAFVGVVAYATYEKPIHVVVAGERAPSFSIAAENGATVSVPKLKGKLLILNFWASWCPPCVEETPSLSQLAKDYAARGLVVMAISVDSREKDYRAFLNKYRPAFLTARDASIHRDYGTFVYPESYIIDAQGKVVQKIAEGADWSSPDIRRYIDSLL
jgi:cytochrome c biogenesis protein CcmG, thiol:disulfide interchange protein DsbE